KADGAQFGVRPQELLLKVHLAAIERDQSGGNLEAACERETKGVVEDLGGGKLREVQGTQIGRQPPRRFGRSPREFTERPSNLVGRIGGGPRGGGQECATVFERESGGIAEIE